MQRLGVARARPDGGGLVYDDVRPTGLEPFVDRLIEQGRRRGPGPDQLGVEIVVEQVQPQYARSTSARPASRRSSSWAMRRSTVAWFTPRLLAAARTESPREFYCTSSQLWRRLHLPLVLEGGLSRPQHLPDCVPRHVQVTCDLLDRLALDEVPA
jgi:hypothetical protein